MSSTADSGAGETRDMWRPAPELHVMRIVVEGHDLPGAEFVSEGVLLHNVHVAIQIGEHPVGLVRGDADSARWEIDGVPRRHISMRPSYALRRAAR